MALRFGVFDHYFVCSFQWGDLTHAHAMRSLELFATEVMPRYATLSASADTRTALTSSTPRLS
jgi:hypothetical protein